MKLTSLLALASAAGSLLLGGCEGAPTFASRPPASAAAAWDEVEDAYAFVFLLAGPREGKLDPEELREAREGHFANMKRLAEDDVLLIAGPLTDPRSDLRHRGVFVFDVVDVEAAREIGESDPGVQLGAFELEVYPFSSPQDLSLVLDRERELQDAKELDADAPGPGTRPYVLATAQGDDALEAIEYLEEKGLAFFHGTFGGELEGTVIVAIDALRADAAKELLAEADEAIGAEVPWTLHGWFSTESLAVLAGR